MFNSKIELVAARKAARARIKAAKAEIKQINKEFPAGDWLF